MNKSFFFFFFGWQIETAVNWPIEILFCSANSSQQIFSIEVQVVNILGFVAYIVSAAIIQLCPYGMKAASDNTQVNKGGCVPIKHSL